MKVSIITINFNNKAGLQKTINSVKGQTFKDFEYLIIDGASTDGSADIIKNCSVVNYWVSEKDNGIYNAMNKGVLVAKGEYLLFLNSGDWFCDNEVLGVFAKDINGFDIVYGDQYSYFPDGKIGKETFPDILTFYYLGYLNSLPHQASLIKKIVLIEHGLYDEEMKMNADWKFFMLAVFKYQCKYLHKPVFVVNFDKDGLSSDPDQFHLRDIEKPPVMRKEFPNFILYENEMKMVNKLEFYYKYSRMARLLKAIGVLKKFEY